MINELFINAQTKKAYENNIQDIHEDALVFIEEEGEESIIAKGKTYTTVPSNGVEGRALIYKNNKPQWLDIQIDALDQMFNNASYDEDARRIRFYHNDVEVASIDATPFIVDNFVDRVVVEDGHVVIKFNSADKSDIKVPITDIFNAENYYTKEQSDAKYVTLQTAENTYVQKSQAIHFVEQSNYVRAIFSNTTLLEKATGDGLIEFWDANKKWFNSSWGKIIAQSFVKDNGTSSQFLKADGSVDSNTYLTTTSASDTYVKKSGDTMSDNLLVHRKDDLVVSVSVLNNFGGVSLNTTQNRGLWDDTDKKWIIARRVGQESLFTHYTDKVDNFNADMIDGKHDGELTAAILGINAIPQEGRWLQWFVRQNKIGTEDGNSFEGSSNNPKLWSFPKGVTSVDTASNVANIMNLRFSWDGNKYFHDLFMSPNNSNLFFRTVNSGTAGDWKQIAFTDSTVENAEKIGGYGVNSLSIGHRMQIKANGGIIRIWMPYSSSSIVNLCGNGSAWKAILFINGYGKGTTDRIDARWLLRGSGNLNVYVNGEVEDEACVYIENKSGAVCEISVFDFLKGTIVKEVSSIPTDAVYVDKTLALTTDTVAAANKLATPVTVWGRSFDGYTNITGDMHNVGSITPSVTNTYDIGNTNNMYRYMYATWFGSNSGYVGFGSNNGYNLVIKNGNVGINNTDPTANLDVNGTIKASGRIESSADSVGIVSKARLAYVNNVGWLQIGDEGNKEGKISGISAVILNTLDIYSSLTRFTGRVVAPKSVFKNTASGSFSITASTYDLEVVHLNGNVSGITLSTFPAVGQDVSMILYGNGAERSVTIKADNTYKTPTGEDIELTVPANGYVEVNFLYDGTNVWVRGV